MCEPLIFLAIKTPNSLSFAIRDHAICMITESIRVKIVDTPLRLTLNTFEPSLYVQ